MRIFVTGAAGFIGFHCAKRLLEEGHEVYGYDSLNDYYDPRYKRARLKVLEDFQRFHFDHGYLENVDQLTCIFKKCAPELVLHLAAQAGVRYSITNPQAYIQSNLIGFQNVIELVRETRPRQFVYASSSSVYGGNKDLPFSESQDVSNPISLYAATKIANELVAKSYGNLFQLPSTGLRFFTVYGPYGRPDMAYFKFSDAIRKGEPIDVYNSGDMVRDFTFVSDIVGGVMAALSKPEIGAVYNLGRGSPVMLLDMITLLEKHLGVEAQKRMMPKQLGDVDATLADISKARMHLGYNPSVSIAEGIAQFATWYKTVS